MNNKIIGNEKYRKVYISGPITGIENDNRKAFSEAKRMFEMLNFIVVNPHDLFTEEEVSKLNDNLTNKEISTDEYWRHFMKRDIAELTTCDFIAVLPYWENSRGANFELAIAKTLGMPIVRADNLQEINFSFSITKFIQ